MAGLGAGATLIHQSQLRTVTDIHEIEQVLRWFEQFHRTEFSPEVWMQAKIVLIEGFTNAVRHAHHRFPMATPIELEAHLFDSCIEIRIWDQGMPFDLDALLNSVEERYPDPLEHEAHWGGTIMKKLTDKYRWNIQYFCSADAGQARNCLWMQKQF
jgi:serine/threonine-protein kinase RsbW